MTDFDSTFIRCDCHTEMLEVSRSADDPDVYLSFWYYGGSEGKMPWRSRLKLHWKLLRTGRGHPDHIVLAPLQTAELRAALSGLQTAPNGAPSITVTPAMFSNVYAVPHSQSTA